MPGNHPSRLKFLDRVNYFGQTSELDGQGRIVVPQLLRDSASIVGDVRVFGRIDYLGGLERRALRAEAASRAVDGRGRLQAVGARDLMGAQAQREPMHARLEP